MELVSLAQEVLQNAAERAASYRLGQSALRLLDRALWVVEKGARWAVPPPLDQDERPQPELVRPLPWVFFLALLITLRVTRESISLVNLIMGKPPLRSADVVTYIQGKRRYLRTLKYQGGRLMRARSSSAPRGPWPRLQSLLQFAMCFRRPQPALCHNNNTRATTDEVMVVKRSKRRQQASSPPPSEATYERLIEHMMIELNADSDDDSSFTLTNATSIKSDQSECTAESDQDTVFQQDVTTTEPTHSSTPTKQNGGRKAISDSEEDKSEICKTDNDESVSFEDAKVHDSPKVQEAKETSEDSNDVGNANAPSSNEIVENDILNVEENNALRNEEDVEQTNGTLDNANATSTPTEDFGQDQSCGIPIRPLPDDTTLSPKEETKNFLVSECTPQKSHRSPKNEKIANGRTVRSVSAKKKGITHFKKFSLSFISKRDHLRSVSTSVANNKQSTKFKPKAPTRDQEYMRGEKCLCHRTILTKEERNSRNCNFER